MYTGIQLVIRFMVSNMSWLTVKEYLCHKSLRTGICSICRDHNPVISSFLIYQRVCNKSNTTSAAGTAYSSGAPCLHQVFREIRVGWSLVLCVCFVDRCLSIWPLCCLFVYSSPIYGFWWPLWYLQTVLAIYTHIFVLRHNFPEYLGEFQIDITHEVHLLINKTEV